MIYLYAIGDSRSHIAEPGIADRPVEAVGHGRLTAYVSSGLPPSVEPTPESLLRHDRVVAAAMGSGAVLPLRFGTVLAGDADLHAALDERAPVLERTLDRVRGTVEMGVRAVWRREAGDPPHSESGRDPASGRDFLLAKLHRRAAARELADALHPALSELAVDSRCALLPRDGSAFSSAYLVQRDRAGELEQLAASLAAGHGDVEVLVTGPWPPYSFSEARDA